MGFSEEWDKLYRQNAQMSIWPWSEMVSFVMRYARPVGADVNVLELGCGAGANIPFFQSLNVNYYAIDGSETIVGILKERYPQYAATIVHGDFTKDIHFPVKFDLVVDRAAVTFNSTSSIQQCLERVFSSMKEKGMYVGINWYSTACSESSLGFPLEDDYTRIDIPEGPFSGMGPVHFSDQNHLNNLFKQFEFTAIEHCESDRILPNQGFRNAWWNFAAEKR